MNAAPPHTKTDWNLISFLRLHTHNTPRPTSWRREQQNAHRKEHNQKPTTHPSTQPCMEETVTLRNITAQPLQPGRTAHISCTVHTTDSQQPHGHTATMRQHHTTPRSLEQTNVAPTNESHSADSHVHLTLAPHDPSRHYQHSRRDGRHSATPQFTNFSTLQFGLRAVSVSHAQARVAWTSRRRWWAWAFR